MCRQADRRTAARHGHVRPPRPGTTVSPTSRLSHHLVHVLDRAFQALVAALANPADGGLDEDVRLDADALELAPVGVPDVVAGEAHAESARQAEERHVTVRSRGGRSDERRAAGRLEEEAGVLAWLMARSSMRATVRPAYFGLSD